MRAGADYLGSYRCAWTARLGWWRPFAHRPDHHCRSVVTSGTADRPGPDRDYVHECQHSRADTRRVSHGPVALVADFLDQPAARLGRPGDERADAAATATQRPSTSARSDRCHIDGLCRPSPDARTCLGRHALSLDLLAYFAIVRHVGYALCVHPRAPADRARAVHPTHDITRTRHQYHHRCRLFRRRHDHRDHDLHAALL